MQKLTFKNTPPTPIVPPPRLRREPRSAAQLTQAHVDALLSGTLQPRDLQIINTVWTLSLITADQLRRLFFYNHASLQSAQRVMRRRLKMLYTEYCLDRWYFSLQSDAIYRLDKQGVRILQAQHGNITWSKKSIASQMFLMLHTLGVAEFFVSLTESIRERQGTVDWVGESTLALKLGADEYFEPDGACRLRVPGKPPVLFFFEWDRGTEKQSEFNDKMRRYRRYHLTKDWRVTLNDLFVGEKGNTAFPPMLIVTTGNKERMVNIIKTVSRYFSGMKITPNDQPVFVSTQTLVEKKGMLGDVYFQVGKSTQDDIIWETGVSILDIGRGGSGATI